MNTDYCFNLAMRKSSRLITQFYEERLSTLDLKVGQFSILRATFFKGSTTNKELQDILVIDQTTLTRNLKPLIRDGYLQLQPDPEDGRIKNISLSKSGKKLYLKALPIWEQTQKEVLNKIGNKQAQAVLDMSNTFVDVFKK
ncbi:MAG: winged helix-turn-helix transcriptional regulator [Saccharospirillaceae bacterium]|nr:MarR family winged helix-turn-helix transcriptional regulator [Pseudomonadales bacterium]NRB80525.1 winged helix-turn-helix transcriptional regulator [Saccharospirillaceae bacterium]